MTDSIRDFLSQPEILAAWVVIDVLCVAHLIWDLRKRNPEMMPVMRLVWILTVAYSGPIGLAIYYYSGRKQIRRDSLWRKGFRSVSHCYSGCGIGEIVGVIISVGVFLSATGPWRSSRLFLLTSLDLFSR